MDMDRLLEATVKHKASDLHLRVNAPPKVRIRGSLRSLGDKNLTPDTTMSLMKSITSEKHQQELNEVGGTDFGLTFRDVARFRVSVFQAKDGIGLVLRQIPQDLMSFEEIGLPDAVRGLCLRPRGLFLVTGPTGCGKTTTLATMIDYVNRERADHIITIEDPIEYIHPHRKCIVTQREIHTDVPTFEEAMRRVLRQDPDVILVGEMRDLETMSLTVSAAETGHLVFSTLHTTGAAKTINRLVDAFPPDQQEQIRTQLAGGLIAVLSQQLLPTTDGKGRVAAYELMITVAAIQNLIREKQIHKIDSVIQTSGRMGMIILDDHLFYLYREGRISLNDMMARSVYPDQLKQKVANWERQQEQQSGKTKSGRWIGRAKATPDEKADS
jgi:twitching motility protein PilT